jgi:hypothetical protein
MNYRTIYYQPSLANKVLHKSINLRKIKYSGYKSKHEAINHVIYRNILRLISSIGSYIEFEVSTKFVDDFTIEIDLNYYKVLNRMRFYELIIALCTTDYVQEDQIKEFDI